MTPSIKLLHAADLHLDSPLTGLSAYEGAPDAEIRRAARHAFDRLIDLALREQITAVLLAGDLFDGDWRDYSSGMFFVDRLRRLRDGDIPVSLLRSRPADRCRPAPRAGGPRPPRGHVGDPQPEGREVLRAFVERPQVFERAGDHGPAPSMPAADHGGRAGREASRTGCTPGLKPSRHLREDRGCESQIPRLAPKRTVGSWEPRGAKLVRGVPPIHHHEVVGG
ncbi:metallophosphoesterase family protein [Saccharothrix sp. ALI-22-I]|uniref:metallophosphoesterase family protein n=1 Tax=Saccharothrix sp. ALI-22-I TaxID=1933778 RepID=UPI00117A41BE|nr:hypothetical protein [Saccharothrix sp. ALI-22-I]